MSHFICFEAEHDDDVTLENENCKGETLSDVDVEFIDDTEYNESVESYYVLENVSWEYDDEIEDSLAGFHFSHEPSNYCSDDEICNEMTEFKDSKK